MALIICNNCGKKISDTADECIHCGAKIRLDVNEKIDEIEYDIEETEVENADKEYDLVKYYSLPVDKQEKLERDFRKSDKEAGAWKEKALNVESFIKASKAFLLISALVFFALRLFSDVLSGKLLDKTNERAGICFAVGLIGFVVVFVISLIALGIAEAVRSLRFGKKKQYVYYRRFADWLLEKNVIFDMEFLSDKDKKIYEKIDLTVDTF